MIRRLPIRRLPITATEAAAIRALQHAVTRWTVSTEPANHAVAEAAVARAYRCLRRAPVPIIWVDSPREALNLLDSIVSPSMMTFPTALDPLSLSLEERWMWADIQSHTDASVRKALRDLLPVSPWANVDLFIRHSLSHEFPAIEALWHSPTQFDQDWTFFRAAHLLGVPYERTILARLEIMDTLTRHAGWFLFHKDCCILCERPTTISIEPFSENSGGPTAYRLHQANGPAMEFRDGWPLYAWHGQTSAHP